MFRHSTILILVLGIPTSLVGAEETHAKVTGGAGESQQATVVLDASADQRLGIVTVPVKRQAVPRSRLFGGEIVLRTPLDVSEDGQSIFALLPEMNASERLRLAESQIDADGAIKLAQVQLEAAEQALARANILLQEKAGSVKAVEEAAALRDLAAPSSVRHSW